MTKTFRECPLVKSRTSSYPRPHSLHLGDLSEEEEEEGGEEEEEEEEEGKCGMCAFPAETCPRGKNAGGAHRSVVEEEEEEEALEMKEEGRRKVV